MNANYTIIDVEPIEHSREKSGSARYEYRPMDDYRREQTAPYSAYTHSGNQAAATEMAENALAGLTQLVVGAGLVLIGIPMLILPGPGLLAICGGLALASSGYRKVFA